MVGLIDPGQKILRHPDLLVKLRDGWPVWPVNVEMDLANTCNLKCSWCDFAYTHNGDVLDTHLATKILTQLRRCGVKAITLTGGGEPTTNPKFREIVHLAAGLGFQIGLYTNGVNSVPILDVLDELTWVYVSLDAGDFATYRNIKKVNAFEAVCHTVTRLAEKKRTWSTVGVGFLLSEKNHFQMEAMYTLYQELGADYCQFRPVISGEGTYGWIRGCLQGLEAFKDKLGVYVSYERFKDLLGATRGYSVCRASAFVPCIGADGTVWVCPNTRGKRPLGSLKTEDFATIWRERKIQYVGEDCRFACRNHALNRTLEYVCSDGPHDNFV